MTACYVFLLPPPFTLVGPPLPGVCAGWPWHSGEHLMCSCLHVFVSVHAHFTVAAGAALFYLHWHEMVMSWVLSALLQEELVIRTINHKIAHPCPEQGDLVHACTVQLPCCSHVVWKWECYVPTTLMVCGWLCMCINLSANHHTCICPLPHRRACVWHCRRRRSGNYSTNGQSLLIDSFACSEQVVGITLLLVCSQRYSVSLNWTCPL